MKKEKMKEDLDALLEEDNEIVHLFPNIKDKV